MGGCQFHQQGKGVSTLHLETFLANPNLSELLYNAITWGVKKKAGAWPNLRDFDLMASGGLGPGISRSSPGGSDVH